MDKSYYYRVLGVSEGASAKEIKQGYEERVKRLKSADYADEPEYASRKLSEATYAYRVLTGGEVPSAKQRQKHYNASKNAAVNIGTAGERLRGKADRTVKSVSGSKEAKSVLGIFFSIIIAVASLAVGSCDTSSTPEYVYDDTAYIESNGQAVERILTRSEEYDFFGHLDDSISVAEDEIEWDITEEISEQLWELNEDLSTALDIRSLPYGIGWYMDDEDYYYETSDYDISLQLAEIMGAPDFEEVAGMVTDNGWVITDFSDYMNFLIDIAWQQTDIICGEPVYY